VEPPRGGRRQERASPAAAPVGIRAGDSEDAPCGGGWLAEQSSAVAAVGDRAGNGGAEVPAAESPSGSETAWDKSPESTSDSVSASVVSAENSFDDSG
jgi:hypothetical protein